MRNLSPTQANFIELFGIDEILVRVASKNSPSTKPATGINPETLIPQLTEAERNAFLLRLANDETHLSLVFNKRLREVSGEVPLMKASGDQQRRTVGQLLSAVERERERERERQVREAEARRIQALDALAQREEQVWLEVDTLIQRSQAKPYDEATQLLIQLRDLSVHQGQEDKFQAHLKEIQERYNRRSALMKRFRQMGLL